MFRIKQYGKMLLQNVLLPVIYSAYARRPVRRGTVLFADAHHDTMPFSMKRMYEEMRQREAQEQCTIELFVSDFGHLSFGAMVKTLVKFMKQYATADYVFICDYFLPVASCHKREETTVVQLWHSCGLMKKIAHDTGQDIPENYKGDMFGNYSVLTLSAPVCVPVHARALKLPEARIHATGVSRTDYYFDREWNEKCRASFYEAYPQARGKKIALWAPTFRGNAAMAHLEGLDEIRRTAKELENEWYFILKAHPHVDAHGQVSNCTIPTEELLVVADVMITDYSSVMFDYLLYKKPIVLFAPDLAQYEAGRGFYLDYRKMPYPITQTGEALAEALAHCGEWMKQHEAEIDAFRELYVGSCDGHSTQRILELVMPQCTR